MSTVAPGQQRRSLGSAMNDADAPPMPLVTVWQVRVEDHWRYATPQVAAMVTANRPGNAKLTDMPSPTSIRRNRHRHLKGRLQIMRPRTPRRMAAARQAIQRDVERAGLFAAVVPVQTPEARLDRLETGLYQQWRDDRVRRAAKWRECRQILRGLPTEARAGLLLSWNESGCSAEPEFLLDQLRHVSRIGTGTTNRPAAMPGHGP
jgi:hypothetical protein